MNYAELKSCDIANGPGVRVSLFVSGCTHRCPGCFNEIAWDFDYGQPFTQETVDQILNMLAPAHIKGLTLLGGEPFEPQNQPAIVELLRQVKAKYPQKTIWAYSGYLFDRDIQKSPKNTSVIWMYWWMAPLFRAERICPCVSVDRITSGSLMYPGLWKQDRSSSGRTGRQKERD